jgi:hypothetical protein
LSYWKGKTNIEEIDTSSDFRLMNQCRNIFGGRSTYALYKVKDVIKMLKNLKKSRQINTDNCRNEIITQLIKIIKSH